MLVPGLAWRIGPLSLHVQRVAGEWQLSHHEEGRESALADWAVQAIDPASTDPEALARFALKTDGDTVRLTPRPADRSVVATPRAQLHVLAGEDARIYVSAPVWVEISAGQPPRTLCEIPTRRLTDTWFGRSTREGEVAYALKTQAHARLENVNTAAYRAVTPVRIHNRGTDPLRLDRMNLPVPYLSIYHDENGSLWTETVTLVRGTDEEMATFQITPGPPGEAREAHRVGEPRQTATGHPLVRAFGRFLRPFQEED